MARVTTAIVMAKEVPAPPEGYRLSGLRVVVLDRPGAIDCPTLGGALDRLVLEGTARSELYAVCVYADTGVPDAQEMVAELDPETGGWSEWRSA